MPEDYVEDTQGEIDSEVGSTSDHSAFMEMDDLFGKMFRKRLEGSRTSVWTCSSQLWSGDLSLSPCGINGI